MEKLIDLLNKIIEKLPLPVVITLIITGMVLVFLDKHPDFIPLDIRFYAFIFFTLSMSTVMLISYYFNLNLQKLNNEKSKAEEEKRNAEEKIKNTQNKIYEAYININQNIMNIEKFLSEINIDETKNNSISNDSMDYIKAELKRLHGSIITIPKTFTENDINHDGDALVNSVSSENYNN